MQAESDIFLGWTHMPGADGVDRDYYVRQLKDWKYSFPIEQTALAGMVVYAGLCGWTLARAHARSGDRVALAAYLGGSDAFDQAIADFAETYAWGPLSGLHINPAVTFAFFARGVFPSKWVVPYWAVQFAGTICAALFLQVMFGDVSTGGNYPINTPGGEWKSLVMEIVLTAILVSVILNMATGARSIGHNAAIAVGSTVALLGLFASPISGASMNPARTLGPDIVGNDYTGWWLYIAGPVIGAAIAVAIIGAVRGLPDKG